MNKAEIEGMVVAGMFGIPGFCIALNILTGDMRYWPDSFSIAAAPYAGVLLLAASSTLIWYGFRAQPTKRKKVR
jgi:hypothetical protein